MPSFFNWPSALIAAGIAIPALLALYFLKLRRRELDVPSTLLWKKAIQDLQVNAPFQRLRRNLLLLLQLLILLMLLLALSRPTIEHSPGAGRLSVIAIDRSASMSAADVDGKPRLEEAKRLARELVDSMGKGAQAMVMAFDDGAEIVQAFTADRALLKRAIDRIEATDRRSSLKTAFQLAEAQTMAFHTDAGATGEKDPPGLWVYSDGRVRDARELVLRFAELRYTKIGTDSAKNVAMVALNAKRNFEKPTQVQVFARLANHGPDPAMVVAQVVVDGVTVPRGFRQVMLVPERWDRVARQKFEKEKNITAQEGVEFNLDLTKAAVVRVEIKENSGDVLRADDAAQIVVPPPRSLNVMTVSEKGNLWIERYLESAQLKKPVTITPKDYLEKMKDPQALAAAADVIIFDRYSPAALPPAGNFIYNGAVPPNTKLRQDTDAAGVALTLKDQTVLDWDRNHPMLRYLNLRFLATDALKLNVPLEAQVLVEGRRGAMIVLYREGRNTHLVFSFDVGDTSWPTLASFPVFMDNALQYLALGSDMDVRASFQPGDTPRIPRYNLIQGGIGEKLKLRDPQGDVKELPVSGTGEFALPALERVGVYETDPQVPQYEKLAVNLLDDNESNLLPVDAPPGGSGKVIQAAQGKSRLDLWWWIVACAAVPLCLIEWWVYTRRVHL